MPSLYFGGLALAIGISSFVNSKLVMRFGMEKMSFFSLIILSISSSIFCMTDTKVVKGKKGDCCSNINH